MATLYLEKRGCNFFKGDLTTAESDIGNYRVVVAFTDKNGVDVCGEIMRCKAWRYTKADGKPLKKPVVVSENGLCVRLEYTDADRITWAYKMPPMPQEFRYCKADILKFINSMAAEEYTEAEVVDEWPA